MSKAPNNCNITFSFDQLASLITNLTSQFTSSIKVMLDKFENFHSNKIENLEGQIFILSERCDHLEKKLEKLSKTNNNLKNLLCESFINKTKDKEHELANQFEISGFSELVVMNNENNLKSP